MAKPRSRGNRQGTLYWDESRGVYVAQKYVNTIDGSDRRITARGRTQTLALANLKVRERQVAASSRDADRTTLEAFLTAWLEHKSASVKPRTAREYKQVLTDHVIPIVGHLRLSKLRPVHLQRVVDELARVGKRVTAHNARRYLSQALQQAVAWEMLDRNPMLGVSRVDVETPKRGLWSVEQTARFLTVARLRTWYHPMFLTAVVTGLRQGELVALPWANVTPEGIVVDRTWSRDALVGYDTPKTRNAFRTVPISSDVYGVLLDRHAVTRSELVFPTRDGTMASPWNAHRAFVQTTQAAGLPRIRFHDLRRIAATLWARQGVEPRVIQQLLGHSTPHLALSVYQGVLEERVGAARLDAGMLFGCNAVKRDETRRHDGDAGSSVLDGLPN